MKIPLTKKFNILWHSGYYDGPLNGLVEYKDKKCYFSCCHESKICRTYNIFELTDEELSVFQSKQADFERMVGTHNRYKNNRRDPEGKVRAKYTNEFWEKYPTELNLGAVILATKQPIAQFKY